MEEAKRVFEGKVAGWIIVFASCAAIILMLHHPSTLNGQDDGLFLSDWSNSFVHIVMLCNLMLLIFAFAILAERVGTYNLLGRAGGLAFTTGLAALVVAASINGIALKSLLTAFPDAAAAHPQLTLIRVMVMSLALFGMGFASLGIACWSLVFLLGKRATKLSGWLGLGLSLSAGWWLTVEGGDFGLYPAVYAVVAFSIWSLLVASQLISGKL
jgi:hypothetical protein